MRCTDKLEINSKDTGLLSGFRITETYEVSLPDNSIVEDPYLDLSIFEPSLAYTTAWSIVRVVLTVQFAWTGLFLMRMV